MCVICLAKERGLTEEEVDNSFKANNHGAGIAYWDKPKILKYKKGMMRVEHFKDVYFGEKLNEILPHVCHFRKASNSISQLLTHPFIVSDTSPLKLVWRGDKPLLFHNGTVANWRTRMYEFFVNGGRKIPGGIFSDTRFLAILVHYCGKNVLNMFDDKFIIVSLETTQAFGDFIEDDGVYFSNNSYKSGDTVYVSSQRSQSSKRGGEYLFDSSIND